MEFLDDIIYSPNLLPAEHKAAAQLLRLLTKEESEMTKIDLNKLLNSPLVIFYAKSLIFLNYIQFPLQTHSQESIETLSALEIAEQLTYIDHQIFISISSE